MLVGGVVGYDVDDYFDVGNDEQNDIVGARTAGIDGVYFRTEISPADDPETSSYAVRSFTGADYEGLLDYVLNA